MIITSFAVSIFLQNIVLVLVSSRARAVPLPSFFSRTVTVASATVPLRNLLVIGVTAVILVSLSLLMKKTVLGMAMRAAADKFTTTRLMACLRTSSSRRRSSSAACSPASPRSSG